MEQVSLVIRLVLETRWAQNVGKLVLGCSLEVFRERYLKEKNQLAPGLGLLHWKNQKGIQLALEMKLGLKWFGLMKAMLLRWLNLTREDE